MTREEGVDKVEELRQWGTGLTVWESSWLEEIDDVLSNRALTRTEEEKLNEIHDDRLPERFQSPAQARGRRQKA